MNFSKLHRPAPRGNTSASQPRQYWNQGAYYKQEDFLPLPRVGTQTTIHRVADHVACQATRVLFACGHVLNEHIPCKEPGMGGKPCPLMNSYAPRHREDLCLRCATKQGDITQVSDLSKPRQLYLQGEVSDKCRTHGGPNVWQPQKYRFDPGSVGERRRAQKEETRTGVNDAWKPKPVLPLFTEGKETVKGKAPKKSRR